MRPKEVTLVSRTQPSGPLCLWQCLDLIPPDFQVKTFTLSISPNFNSFSDKNTKKWVKMEKYTPLAKILHCRRQWRHWQISPLFVGSTHANSGEVLWGRPRLPSRQDNLHCRFCGKVLFPLSLSMIFILLRQHMVIFFVISTFTLTF